MGHCWYCSVRNVLKRQLLNNTSPLFNRTGWEEVFKSHSTVFQLITAVGVNSDQNGLINTPPYVDPGIVQTC